MPQRQPDAPPVNYIIWTPGRPRRSLPPNTIYLKLQAYGRNEVRVVACHPNGRPYACGNLIAFTASGRIIHHTSIEETLPFDLTAGGTIRHDND